jgi:hypothetical protein
VPTPNGAATGRAVGFTLPAAAAINSRAMRPRSSAWLRLCALLVPLWLAAAPASARERRPGEPLFPDPALEAAVRKQVFAKRHTAEPLVEADVVNVSTVEAKAAGITNLAGLEACTALALLDLENNRVRDLAPLAGRPRLQSLNLAGNLVTDLAPLAQVPALQYLELSRNRVRDLAPLAGLTNLSALYLSSNLVSDLRPLLGLRRLSSLYLDGNQLRSIQGLGQLRGLFSLSLRDNAISDLAPLQGLASLHQLFLENNRLQDLGALLAMLEADQEQRFAPFLNVYLAGNPLGTAARTRQLEAIRALGTRVHR